MESGEHLCLLRASCGNRKISTVVSGNMVAASVLLGSGEGAVEE